MIPSGLPRWLLLALLLIVAPPLRAAGAEADRALSLLDYVAVEYPQFVRAGEVLDPGEYAEQVEFSGRVVTLLKALPARPGHETLLRDAEALAGRIAAKADGAEVAQRAGQLKRSLIAIHALVLGPATAPDVSVAVSSTLRVVLNVTVRRALETVRQPARWTPGPLHSPTRCASRDAASRPSTASSPRESTAPPWRASRISRTPIAGRWPST